MTENMNQSPLVRQIENQAAAKVAAPAVATSATPVPSPQGQYSVLTSIELKLQTIERAIVANAAKDASYIQKYWPIAAGILIAASRFVHL